MVRRSIIGLIAAALFLLLAAAVAASSPRGIPGMITSTQTVTETLGRSPDVCFSPGGGCANELIGWIDRANVTIHVMIYSFTNDEASTSLIRARDRGVEVKVVLDDQQVEVSGGEYSTLVNAGMEVRVDRRAGLMHNKVVVIDHRVVITGSYNWSAAAEESNRENLLVLEDPRLASEYEENFEAVWRASIP